MIENRVPFTSQGYLSRMSFVVHLIVNIAALAVPYLMAEKLGIPEWIGAVPGVPVYLYGSFCAARKRSVDINGTESNSAAYGAAGAIGMIVPYLNFLLFAIFALYPGKVSSGLQGGVRGVSQGDALSGELRRLSELRQSGALTEEEFKQAKATALKKAS